MDHFAKSEFVESLLDKNKDKELVSVINDNGLRANLKIVDAQTRRDNFHLIQYSLESLNNSLLTRYDLDVTKQEEVDLIKGLYLVINLYDGEKLDRKGLSERKVVGKHAFRNTLIPIITFIGGSIPGLFAGAIITEGIFAIDGLGNTALLAVNNKDFPFLMTYLMFMAVLTLLGTLISDILYGIADPRVRLR